MTEIKLKEFTQLKADNVQLLWDNNLSPSEWRLITFFSLLDPFGDKWLELPSVDSILKLLKLGKSSFYAGVRKLISLGLIELRRGVFFRNLTGSQANREVISKEVIETPKEAFKAQIKEDLVKEDLVEEIKVEEVRVDKPKSMGELTTGRKRLNPNEINWNWLPQGIWNNQGKLDLGFHEWLAKEFMRNYNTENIFKAKADVLSYFKNDPLKLPIKWEQYEAETKAKIDNVQKRIDNGCQIKDSEKLTLVNSLSAMQKLDHSQSVSMQNELLVTKEETMPLIIESEATDLIVDKYGNAVRLKTFRAEDIEEVPVNPKFSELLRGFLGRSFRKE